MILVCAMDARCTGRVTMVDIKGYVYCSGHGVARRTVHGVQCRKLSPQELSILAAGGEISYKKVC